MRGSRVFLTGATGAMGASIVRALAARGIAVEGPARDDRAAAALRRLGGRPVDVSLFDVSALEDALRGVDTLAHFATRIPRGFDQARLGSWADNDRLRREGTEALLEAATRAGVRRFVFESISLAYPDRGDDWTDESVPLVAVSPVMRTAIAAESRVARFAGEGVSLRFGRLYGPGRASEDLVAALRARQMPIVGRGANYVSSIHSEDVGAAVLAALHVEPGAYNVVDDEPVTQRVWVESVAAAVGARAPRRVPEIVARLLMGHAAKVLTVSQRVSNRRFRASSGWSPRVPSIRLGASTLGSPSAPENHARAS